LTESAIKVRLCPCGARLERKSGENLAGFEKRRFCDSRCRGRYLKVESAACHFGLKSPVDKSKLRAGPGIQAYLGSYRSRAW
jgi:hypothetical protein